MRRRIVITTAGAITVCAIVAAVAVGIVRKNQRDREWTHGGDSLITTVDLRLADTDTFSAAVSELGGPSDHQTGTRPGIQALIGRVRWSGGPGRGEDCYSLMALDKRVFPPRILLANTAWTPGSDSHGTGSHGVEMYAELAKHYDWLGYTALVEYTPLAERTATPFQFFTESAVSTEATSSGTIVVHWMTGTVPGEQLPFEDASAEVIIALVYLKDCHEIRWAKRVYG